MNNDKDNATLYAELKAERFMTDQISLLHEAEENHTSTNTYE